MGRSGALPDAWPQGFVKGIRARGGYELNLYWINGQLDQVTIYNRSGKGCRIRYREKEVAVKGSSDEVTLTAAEFK